MTLRTAARVMAPRLRLRALWLSGAVIVGALGGSASSARADNSPYLQRENPLRSLVPTPEARTERTRVELERKLKGLLSAQPGVAQADVVVSLPVAASAPLEQPVPPARAAIVVQVQDEREDLRGLIELARGVLPAGTDLQLTRVEAATTGPRRAKAPSRAAVGPAGRVGPFWVDGKSAGPLRATLAGLLASNAVLAGLLLWRRARR